MLDFWLRFYCGLRRYGRGTLSGDAAAGCRCGWGLFSGPDFLFRLRVRIRFGRRFGFVNGLRFRVAGQFWLWFVAAAAGDGGQISAFPFASLIGPIM